ncbi:MAG: hypothetical protein ABSA78_08655 [Candidatus Sulfotelmatobacter sp.]|jgi:hypothetical protein
MPDSGLLQEWGQLMAGKWKIQSAQPGDGGALAVSNGNHTISWMEGGGALEAVCIPPDNGSTAAASRGSRWLAVYDSASGQIKQTTVNADGTTDVAFIGKKNGQWGWNQTRTFPNGATETNCAEFTVSDGGKTITQHVSQRVLNHPQAQGGPLGLAEICNVLTKVG